MYSLELNDSNIKKISNSFNGLSKGPDRTVNNSVGVQLVPFKRMDRFRCVRTIPKSQINSREEFLVYCCQMETFPERAGADHLLEELVTKPISKTELMRLYEKVETLVKYLPNVSDIEYSCVVENNSQLSWTFLENDTTYYSIFWSESETKLFGKRAYQSAQLSCY